MKAREPNSYNHKRLLLFRRRPGPSQMKMRRFRFGISRSSNADGKRDPLTLDRLLDKAHLPRKLEKLTPWQVSRRSSSGASRASSMGANHVLDDTLCKCGLVDTTA